MVQVNVELDIIQNKLVRLIMVEEGVASKSAVLQKIIDYALLKK